MIFETSHLFLTSNNQILEMKNAFLILFMMAFYFTNAQYKITGNVLDSKKNPLEFVNVILYQQKDSSFVKGTTTEIDGTFTIEKVKEGTYFLKTALLSYQDFNSEKIELNEQNPHHKIKINLIEDVAVLGEVEIVAKKPLLEQQVDKLIVNVEDHITGNDGNLLEVLKKIPGLIVVNDQISLAGNSNPTILIDGRTTKYMDLDALLKEMPGDNIEKIEVINQPGAEYDASGTGPIINIILKKNKLFGTNGSVSYNISKARGWRNRVGVYLNNRNGKFNIYGSAGISKSYYFDSLHVDRILGNDFYLQNNKTPSTPFTQRANVGLDYYLNDMQTIGFSVKGINSENNRQHNSRTNLGIIDSTELEINSINQLESTWRNFATDAYYSLKLDTLGQKFDVDASAIFFDRTFDNNIEIDNSKTKKYKTRRHKNLYFKSRLYKTNK